MVVEAPFQYSLAQFTIRESRAPDKQLAVYRAYLNDSRSIPHQWPTETIQMTEPHVIPAAALEVSGEPEPALERVSARPILITEQEVAFGTAAALGVQLRTTRWWIRATRVIAAATRRMFLTLMADSRRPRRYGFLENALMAREMDRL